MTTRKQLEQEAEELYPGSGYEAVEIAKTIARQQAHVRAKTISAEQVEKAEREYQRAYLEGVRNAPSNRNGITREDAKKVCQNAMTAAFRAAGLYIEGEE